MQSLVGPCKSKYESRIPPIWNLNPESKPFWNMNPRKLLWNLNPRKFKNALWIYGRSRLFTNPESQVWPKLQDQGLKSESWILPFLKFESWILLILKFESRIPGLFEIWIQNPWTSPYRALLVVFPLRLLWSYHPCLGIEVVRHCIYLLPSLIHAFNIACHGTTTESFSWWDCGVIDQIVTPL